MTREELERLSNETFFDNNTGEIQPAGHRNFNSQLIDFIIACFETGKQYAVEKIAELVGGAPEQLNALNELAAAINNDPNFAATIMQLIGQKLDATNYTAADVLAKLLAVDGYGSRLVADFIADRKDASTLGFWSGTQSEYDAIAIKDPRTIYIVL